MRAALLEGPVRASMASETAFLAGFALVLLPLGLFAFSYSLQRARIQGTLSSY